MGRHVATGAVVLIGLALVSVSLATSEEAFARAGEKASEAANAAASTNAFAKVMTSSKAGSMVKTQEKALSAEQAQAQSSWVSPTPRRIWLDDVWSCNMHGNDLVRYCHHTRIGHHNCGHHEDVALCCRWHQHQDCYKGHAAGKRMRVATLNRQGFGRLEFYHHGQWGSVCDDGFNHNSAVMACRTAGLPDRYVHWTNINNVMQACSIGRCQHGGHHSSPWRGCVCRCRGIWTGRNCEREIQRSCSSLQGDINALIEQQARHQQVPVNIMQAAFGFAISQFHGVGEITSGLRQLQQRQHGTNNCVRWLRSSGFLHSSMQVPQTVSDLTGIDVTHLLTRMRSVNDRMRLLMDVNMMPPMPGQAQNSKRAITQFKQFLGFSGEMPWERNKRIRESQMAAVSHEKEQSARRAEKLHALLGAIEEKRGSHKRRIGDVSGALARDQNEFTQSEAVQRRSHHVQESMADGLDEESTRVRDHIADLNTVSKKIQDVLVGSPDKYVRRDSVKVQTAGNHNSKEFTEDIKKEVKEIRKDDAVIVRASKEPLHKALHALTGFYIRRFRLKRKHHRELRSLRTLLKALTARFKIDTAHRIKSAKRDLQENAVRMANDYKKRTEIKVKRLADTHENFQNNNIRNLQHRQDYMHHVIQSVKKGLAEIAIEEYQHLLKIKQQLEEMKNKAHTQETHMGQDLENTKARVGVLKNDLGSAESQNKASMDGELLGLEKDAQHKSHNYETKIETRSKSIENLQLGQLDRLQTALATTNTKLESLMSTISNLDLKNKALEADFEKQRKAVSGVISDVHAKLNVALARVPTHDEVEEEHNMKVDEMRKYCHALGKSTGEHAARTASVGEIAKRNLNDVVGGSEVFQSACAALEKATKPEPASQNHH